MLKGADRLGKVLRDKPPQFFLCHADIHGWNVIIQPDGSFYVVDWDTVTLAPKERDLMSIASGLFGKDRTPEKEEMLFYQGYGNQDQVDPLGLAYYRYERIIRDIAEYCELILHSSSSPEGREKGLQQLATQFKSGNVVEIAMRSEKFLP